MKIYRSMIVASDGLPEVGRSPRALGVRLADQAPNEDVKALLPDDIVSFGKGGMSVAPEDPRFLSRHRKPPEYGGTGKDPVWVIDSDELPEVLEFRRDKPTHGVIEPSQGTTMKLSEYETALYNTRGLWKIVESESTGEQP